MNLQLKKTDTNTYIIDLDADIKAKSVIYDTNENTVEIVEHVGNTDVRIVGGYVAKEHCKQIIAQLNPELPNILQFEIVNQKDDVEKLARIDYENENKRLLNVGGIKSAFNYIKAFKRGFSTHEELNKAKEFTLQNIEEAIEFGLQYAFDQRFVIKYMEDKDKFIQSLSTADLDGREVEIQERLEKQFDLMGNDYTYESKPIRTLEGKLIVKLK